MFYKSHARPDRYFAHKVSYKTISTTMDLSQIIDLFSQRIQEWYIDPVKWLQLPESTGNGRFAFAAMSITCTLIDTLSQYYTGNIKSNGQTFKDFLRDFIPQASHVLNVKILHDYNYTPAREIHNEMSDYADVIYHAFRCGILHQAHVTPYGMLDGKVPLFSEDSGYVEYRDTSSTNYTSGTPCPTVIINPWGLFKEMNAVFDNYIQDLKDPNKVNTLREHFKTKFTSSFGIDITNAQL